ncbi:MAG: NosD domain-containing protein [Thermoplasmatota archaeon]
MPQSLIVKKFRYHQRKTIIPYTEELVRGDPMKLYRGLLAAFAVMIFLGSGSLFLNDPHDVMGGGTSWSPHSPVRIDSDESLIENATAKGWPGTGSPADPIIMEDLVIDAPYSQYGIYIGNTTLHLSIINVTIRNVTIAGIELLDTEQVTISSSRISTYQIGIMVNYCSNTIVSDNTIHGGSTGLYVNQGNNNKLNANTLNSTGVVAISCNQESDLEIANNQLNINMGSGILVSKCTYSGIIGNIVNNYNNGTYTAYVQNSAQIQISGNTLIGGWTSLRLYDTLSADIDSNVLIDSKYGLELFQSPITARNNVFIRSGVVISRGISGRQWMDLMSLDRSNTVNGKPIIVARSRNDIDQIPPAVGQIMIIGVDNYTIPGRNISLTSSGVQILFSYNLTIKGYVIKNCTRGIEIIQGYNCTIRGNSVGGCEEEGIYLSGGSSNSIIDNLIYDAPKWQSQSGGLELSSSDDNHIHGNTFFNRLAHPRSNGLKLYFSDGNEIWDNYFFYCNGTGDSYKPFTYQAMDMMGTNQYNSPDKVGNYWRDWREPDDNGDGIVDIPYVIGASGAAMPDDRFPMTTCPVVEPPSDLKITPGSSMLQLTWKEPAQKNYTHILSYNVFRKNETDDFSLIGSTAYPSEQYVDDNVTYGENYTYYVTAVNQLIESDPSSTVTGNLDVKDPYLEIISPLNGSYLGSRDVRIIWVVRDNESGLDRVEISLDSGNWTDLGISTNYQYSELEEGPHTARVTAVDKASRTNTSLLHFTVDVTPPELKLITPLNDTVHTSRFITASWEATDSISPLSRNLIRWDGREWLDVGNYSFHTMEFRSDGTHLIEVAVEDMAGNRMEVSSVILIDSFMPELVIITPDDGSMVRDGNIKVTWTGGDNGTGLKGYYFRMDDTNWTFMGMRTDKDLWQLNDGVYRLQVMAVDIAGNIRVEMAVVTVDATRPSLIIETPVDGSYISEKTVSVRWNGTDETSGVGFYEISLDGNKWEDVGDDLSFTMVNLKEGAYTFHVRLWDRAGNSRAVSTKFIMDQTRPKALTYTPVGSRVPVDSVISVTFSERMEARTIQFQVNNISGTLDWQGERLIFQPDGNLSWGEEYHVVVLGWDLAGNRLPLLEWYFQTDSRGIIQGFVWDKGLDPIPFARLSIIGGNETRSREDGFFTMKVESGRRTLVVEADGYHRTTVELDVEAGKTIVIDRLVLTRKGSGDPSALTIILWILAILMVVGAVTVLAIYLGSKRFQGTGGDYLGPYEE